MSVLNQEKSAATAPAVKLEPTASGGAGRKSAWGDPQSAFHRYAVVVIFGVACLLLSLLIVEQQQVIDSQRALIRQLFQDSQELNDIRIQNLHPARPHAK